MARRRIFRFNLDKRKKFVAAAIILSFGLLISQYIPGEGRVAASIILSFLSVGFLFGIIYPDIKGTFAYPLFILPFFYTLALGIFYFLVPERLLTRLAVTGLFSVTIYALFLATNIYAVSSIRTIQLLRAAHAVSFILTLIAFFILINIIFTLHLFPPLIFIAIFVASFPLVLQLIWSILLEPRISQIILLFSVSLAVIIAQLGTMLSFWPVVPTVAAIFLAGNFYTFVGLTQYWLERRLFKEILWEYIWVVGVVFVVLLVTTKWGG